MPFAVGRITGEWLNARGYLRKASGAATGLARRPLSVRFVREGALVFGADIDETGFARTSELL